jgi:hypothetical protein
MKYALLHVVYRPLVATSSRSLFAILPFALPMHDLRSWMYAFRVDDATMKSYDATIFCAHAAIFNPDLPKGKSDPSICVHDDATKMCKVAT